MPDSDAPKNTVNLAGTMPSEPANGLLGIVDDLVDHPGLRRIAVVEFYAMKRTHNTDLGNTQAVVRFSQIEPLKGDAAKQAEALLQASQAERLGMLITTIGGDE